ncbi:monocarboxylate transporter 12-like isoform X2 [Octopus sinensis]|uniref:Monocarboxylate transporter 12-like isoform X2 n=1 Tax=Octopus sinensis TaxID=2607531 RepID=A0A7E6FHE2_9MOLL|nr:monocarboxylate transporter 12-like isoform X2 [Octopus sinensis]
MTKGETKVPIVPDGGYGWIVCIAALLSNCIISGFALSAGVLLVELLKNFNEPVSTISLILSLRTGLNLCVGISLGMCFFAANVIVGHYFDKKRATAVGMAVCGVGLGMFIFNNVTEMLLQHYGLKGTLLLSSGIVLNLVPLGALVRPLKYKTVSECEELQVIELDSVEKDGEHLKGKEKLENANDEHRMELCPDKSPEKEGTESNDGKSSSKNIMTKCLSSMNLDLLTNTNMLLFCMIVLIWASQHTVIYYLPYYAISLGMTRSEGAIFVSLIGISWVIAKLLSGVYSDVFHIRCDTVLVVALGIATLAVITFPYCTNFWSIIACTVVYSLSVGTVIPIRLTMVADLFSSKYITSGFSLILFFNGIGYTIFPPIFGKIYDATESFPVLFRVNGAIYFFAEIFTIIIIIRRKMGKK